MPLNEHISPIMARWEAVLARYEQMRGGNEDSDSRERYLLTQVADLLTDLRDLHPDKTTQPPELTEAKDKIISFVLETTS